jgi:Lar family restriction alleviation protein
MTSPLDEAVELKPCPFCGGGAELREMAPYPNQRPGEYYATCPSCDIVPDQAWSKPRAEAIAAWNTRTILNALSPDEERVARAIAYEFDVDADMFIGMHGREKWEKQWHPIARAAIQSIVGERDD